MQCVALYKELFDRHLTANFDSAFCGMLNIIFVFFTAFMAFMGSDFYANDKSITDNLFIYKKNDYQSAP
jgi:hypothetical protein